MSVHFIYIYLSKFLALFNLFSFFYLLCFISVVTHRISERDLNLYKSVITDVKCECMDKTIESGIVNLENEELLPEKDYLDFGLFCFSVFFSSFLTYYNGFSYSSENKRITYLIKGKLNIELYKTESQSLCDKKFCDFLNMLICYKLTLLQILRYLTLISLAIFFDSLILLILGLTHSWTQAGLLGNPFLISFNLVFPFLVIIASLYCKGSDWCDKDNPPSKRKCSMLILLILSFIFFPA